MSVRSADRLALVTLVRVVPALVIEDAVRECGQEAGRVRTLPPWVTAYHVLAAAMSPAATFDEITELLWSTLGAATGRGLARRAPSAGAVSRARVRLGCAPLSVLLDRLVRAVCRCDESEAVYLQQVLVLPASHLWWLCAADGVGLRGCDLRGEDIGAAVDLVERSPSRRVVVCPPYVDRSRELLERLRRYGSGHQGEVGELPPGQRAPWTTFRGRTPLAWDQEALAQAVVAVALEASLVGADITRAGY
ncbi:MAG: transposase domain-containing protein [Mycobacterium sp.]